MLGDKPGVPQYFRPSKEELPKSARRLDTTDVIAHIRKQILRSPREKVWPLLYSNAILSASSAVTGVAILVRLRRGFNLGGLGLPFSLLPTIGLSTIPTYALHTVIITNPIVTAQYNRCVECAQVKASICQLGTGVVYPMIIAPMMAYGMVKKYQTAPAPVMYPFAAFRASFMRYFIRPAVPLLVGSAVVQVGLAMYLTRSQYQTFIWLMNRDDALVHTR